MQYFIILLIIFKITNCSHVGTSLFHNRISSSRFNCWNERDINKLRARKVFEEIVPPAVPPSRITDRYVRDIMRYFRRALRLVDNPEETTSLILKEALADTIGAHMRSEILPAARFAYYAGFLSYRRTRELHNYYDSIKLYLNSQGLGWRQPRMPIWSNLTVEKINIYSGIFDSCELLVSKRDTNSCIHLPPPKTDDSEHPTAIVLPFKSHSLLGLMSPRSESVILKYYTTASRCLLKRSPQSCRHKDFVSFNNEMWHWLKHDVAPHLMEERLYTAFGGVLRVAAATQNYGKGLSRRNLFTFDSNGISKWHTWRALKNSYVFINADWTPYCCVLGILLIGVAICLIQVFYSYVFGDDDVCHCRGPQSSNKDVEYAKTDTNIPGMLPTYNNVFYADHVKRSVSKVGTATLSSGKTKVYDLNENKEKIMDIIIGESDTSVESAERNDNVIDFGCMNRCSSPPKIETSIDEVKVSRCTRPGVYSRSETYQETETVWSGTESSSVTTDSSRSRCRRSKSSRDLAWARRVLSKHSLRTTSATTVDCKPFMTPPSRR